MTTRDPVRPRVAERPFLLDDAGVSPWVKQGRGVLEELGGRLDDLHAASAAPLTSRRTWLQAWVDSSPQWQPWAVGVDDPDGSLAAVALLAVRRVGPVDRVVLMGHGPSDLLVLPSRDEGAARVLGRAVASWLRERGRRPWHVYARHLRAGDAATDSLATELRSRVQPGDVSPALHAVQGPGLDQYVTGSHRRGVSRVRNRLAREGHALEISHVSSAEGVNALLPEIERVMLARDRSLGRTSDLDLPGPREFFRAAITRHAEADAVRLTCVHVDGRLAAYVLCFVDGSAYRMWNCRFDPSLATFSPGRIAMDESVRQALDDGVVLYDFMRGEERYKDGYANRYDVAVDLSASSNAVLHAGEGLALRARARLRVMDEAGGRAGAAADQLRSLMGRVRG